MTNDAKRLKSKYIMPDSEVHKAVLKQLDSKGWDLICMGGDFVTKNLQDDKPYKYWYVVPFLGGNKKLNEPETKGVKC